jgi:pimeloyl-ACP methyl ester carboxylesterase
VQVQHFSSAGVDIAFRDEGEGPPVLLVHGFASSSRINWLNPSWFVALNKAGFRAIAIDNRGHGESEKLYAPADYPVATMAEDAARLLDHLGVETADVIGYSMGGRIGVALAIEHPARVRRLVLGGVGESLVAGMRNGEAIAQALEASDPEEVEDEAALGFRRFADRNGSDRRALAACARALVTPFAPERIAEIGQEVLIVNGAEDRVAGSTEALTALLRRSKLLEIPRRDHMTTVGDKAFKEAALEFLAARV